MAAVPPRVQAFRVEYRDKRIGPLYRGWAHFAFTSAGALGLFVCISMGYFLTYEWLHFAYHLREDSWVGRLPLMATLRRHHRTHHDLARMGRYNFSITFPLCDWVFGSLYREHV